MDSDKLIIGGVIVIALIIAIPILAPMLSGGNGYDAVADSHKIQELTDAINAYGQETGQYPPSLYDLAPKYITEIPLTSANEQFGYNPVDGSISNPSAPAEPVSASNDTTDKKKRKPGSGTLSPASEAMTGLGVSEELNY